MTVIKPNPIKNPYKIDKIGIKNTTTERPALPKHVNKCLNLYETGFVSVLEIVPSLISSKIFHVVSLFPIANVRTN